MVSPFHVIGTKTRASFNKILGCIYVSSWITGRKYRLSCGAKMRNRRYHRDEWGDCRPIVADKTGLPFNRYTDYAYIACAKHLSGRNHRPSCHKKRGDRMYFREGTRSSLGTHCSAFSTIIPSATQTPAVIHAYCNTPSTKYFTKVPTSVLSAVACKAIMAAIFLPELRNCQGCYTAAPVIEHCFWQFICLLRTLYRS